jgi:hypothetical protein
MPLSSIIIMCVYIYIHIGYSLALGIDRLVRLIMESELKL